MASAYKQRKISQFPLYMSGMFHVHVYLHIPYILCECSLKNTSADLYSTIVAWNFGNLVKST